MKIIFTKSPTGAFKLAYSAGEKADLPNELAKELIRDNYAIAQEEDAPTDIKKMSKPQLIEYAKANSIQIDESANKPFILEAIQNFEESQKQD